MHTQSITEDTGHSSPQFLLISLLVALFLVFLGYAEYYRADTALRPVSEVTLAINKTLDANHEDFGYKDLSLLALTVRDADATLKRYNAMFPIETMVKHDREQSFNEAVKLLTQRIKDGD